MAVRDALLRAVSHEARRLAAQVGLDHPAIPAGFDVAIRDGRYRSDLIAAAERLDLEDFEWFLRFIHTEVWNSVHPDQLTIYGQILPKPVGRVIQIQFSWRGPGTFEILSHSGMAIGVVARRGALLPRRDRELAVWWDDNIRPQQQASPYWQDRLRPPDQLERLCWLWARRAELRCVGVRGTGLYTQLREQAGQHWDLRDDELDEWSIRRELQRLRDGYLADPS